MLLHVLGSGSKGNCAIISSSTTSVMIDCGLSRKAQRERMESLGIAEIRPSALLITHEHSDHVKGLGVCLRGMRVEGGLPIFCSAGTRKNTAYLAEYENFQQIGSGSGFTVGDIHIDVFDTSHDAAEPLGFRFTYAGSGLEPGATTIGYMTDSGYCTPLAHEMLENCQILAIETNHDPKMLKNGPYPTYLKQRIASDIGHMSNDQAGETLEGLISDDLGFVIGMHISQENNYVDLPANLIKETLQRSGHEAGVDIAGQNIPRTIGI